MVSIDIDDKKTLFFPFRSIIIGRMKSCCLFVFEVSLCYHLNISYNKCLSILPAAQKFTLSDLIKYFVAIILLLLIANNIRNCMKKKMMMLLSFLWNKIIYSGDANCE